MFLLLRTLWTLLVLLTPAHPLAPVTTLGQPSLWRDYPLTGVSSDSCSHCLWVIPALHCLIKCNVFNISSAQTLSSEKAGIVALFATAHSLPGTKRHTHCTLSKYFLNEQINTFGCSLKWIYPFNKHLSISIHTCQVSSEYQGWFHMLHRGEPTIMQSSPYPHGAHSLFGRGRHSTDKTIR